MRDKDWVGRLVDFRDKLTLGESELRNNRRAIIYSGRIKQVFRKEDGRLYAIADLILKSSIEVTWFNTSPDPNWTVEQYSRRRHHRTIFQAMSGSKIKWTSASGEMLLRYKGPKWKPVKI